MNSNERTIVGGLVTLLLILWLGFAFHTAPRFAGSLAGGVLAVVGSLLISCRWRIFSSSASSR